MIDLIIIIMAGIVLLFLLSCCFMVARLLDEEISMYGYEGKEKQNIKYYGAFMPDELPFAMKGSFGLVWDGAVSYTHLTLPTIA